jgi:hypothetical protein
MNSRDERLQLLPEKVDAGCTLKLVEHLVAKRSKVRVGRVVLLDFKLPAIDDLVEGIPFETSHNEHMTG